jgi:hypothetical protein
MLFEEIWITALNLLWTYVCLYATLYAHEADSPVLERTAIDKAPDAI